MCGRPGARTRDALRLPVSLHATAGRRLAVGHCTTVAILVPQDKALLDTRLIADYPNMKYREPNKMSLLEFNWLRGRQQLLHRRGGQVGWGRMGCVAV